MRRTIPVIALACAAAAAGCTDQPQGPDEIVLPLFVTSNTSDHWGTAMAGHKERPTPVNTRARGVATFSLSEDGTTMSYKLIVANLRNATQAHIHIAPVDSAGPVVVWLFGAGDPPTAPIPGGVTKNGILAEDSFTQANLIARPAIGFGATMAELIALMNNGRAYVNVHTVLHPPGEIRGQIEERGPTR